MEAFKGNNQDLELHPEVDQQPVQLTEQWCNMDPPRDPKNCPHCHTLHQLKIYIWSILEGEKKQLFGKKTAWICL